MPDSFAHYKSGTGSDCELRSVRKDGQDYIRQLEIESRNQRLELYNKRLWQIISKDTECRPSVIGKIIGNRWLDDMTKLCRLEMASSLSFYEEEVRQTIIDMPQIVREGIMIHKATNQALGTEARDEFVRQLQTIDTHLQEVIAREVVGFLATRTGGYALRKLIALTVALCCCTAWIKESGTAPSHERAVRLFGKITIFNLTPHLVAKYISRLLSQVNWIEVFKND